MHIRINTVLSRLMCSVHCTSPWALFCLQVVRVFFPIDVLFSTHFLILGSMCEIILTSHKKTNKHHINKSI